MTVAVGGYVGARTCTGGPSPGAKALMAWFLGAYQGLGGYNLGIYNCRNGRGSTTLSLHGEGRAGDLGHPVGAGFVDSLAEALRGSSAELGVQCVITKEGGGSRRPRIWSSKYPNWRDYSGVNPHADHLHVELTPWAAANLTVDHINRVMSGAAVPTPGDDMALTDTDIHRIWLFRIYGTPAHDLLSAAAGTPAALRSEGITGNAQTAATYVVQLAAASAALDAQVKELKAIAQADASNDVTAEQIEELLQGVVRGDLDVQAVADRLTVAVKPPVT